jgi:hypothetical protein
MASVLAASGKYAGKDAGKKAVGFVLGLIGAGLAVVAVGQWKTTTTTTNEDGTTNEAQSSKDQLIGVLQWSIFAALLLFVAYKLVRSKTRVNNGG